MKPILAWLFLPALVLAFSIGKHVGSRVEQHPGAEELKLTIHNLKRSSDTMSPQLREYLKGRAYTLLVGGIRSDWVDDQVDYGRIDRTVLGSIVVTKGPESDEDLYGMAMAEAGIAPAEPGGRPKDN